MKVVTVVGARPQFIKAALVSRRLADVAGVEECLVHTGQHYDEAMSQVFFDQMGIPHPAHSLSIGSGRHGEQTGRMLMELERVLLEEKPDATLVYGDTNSTLAGALASAKLGTPVVHVEAGLRSFNAAMPEEVNRVLTDHASTLLLCPTQDAVKNATAEGLADRARLVGDVMYDTALFFSEIAQRKCRALAELGLTPGGYTLVTCHRAENTDDPTRFGEILLAIRQLSHETPTVFPVHPRIKELVAPLRNEPPEGLRMIPPASYLEMLALTRNAGVVVTDSGGLQKEAFFFGVPCVTMRDETEWTETINAGANVLVGASSRKIAETAKERLAGSNKLPAAGPYYGDGKAATAIAEAVASLRA